MIDAIRSEWSKIRATRSPKVCALVALIFGVGLPVLLAFATRNTVDDDSSRLSVLAGGVTAAMVTLMVMAVIAVAAEYRFAMIRLSLAATPKRLRFFAAKLGVLAAIAAVVGAVSVPLAWLVANPILAGGTVDRSVGFGDADVARVLGSIPVVLLVATLMAGAVAFMVRSAAAGISIIIVWALLVEPLFSGLPWVSEHVGPYLPFTAITRLTSTGATLDHQLQPWAGFAVGCAWTVVLLALAGALLQRRDA